MTAIDYKEIPPANSSNGQQDTFELFARDFIQTVLKFKILSQPNRGADGGKDILAEESRYGTVSEDRIKWLVSCKHFTESGRSVSEADEQNITDRLEQHSAQGFLGFYSTLASSGLGNRIDALKSKYEVEVFDGRRIEEMILGRNHYQLLRRYFPDSYSKWVEKSKEPTLLMNEYQPLPCAVCGQDLLVGKSDGLLVFSKKFGSDKYENVVGVCRGKCDHIYSGSLREMGYGTAWDDIGDFLIPTIYLRKQMSIINDLYYRKDSSFTKEGIEAYKLVIIALSQFVLRKQTDDELERAKVLNELPDGI